MTNDWWGKKPRKINVIVDNDSWFIESAKVLVQKINNNLGDCATFVSEPSLIPDSDIAFYLSCVKITPESTLKKAKKNLVVHASQLPEGKGFSPLTWQILEGRKDIPITLFEMVGELDSGPIVYRDSMSFEGHELLGELRTHLSDKTIELCLRYLTEPDPPVSIPQEGDSTVYARRRARDSQLDIDKSIREQFQLMRVVDNDKYPAFFEYLGHTYILKIEKK